MRFGIKFRLVAFGAAMVLVALGFGWVAHTSWRHLEQLSEKLTHAQIESFQTADQFRARLREMDVLLARYEIHRDPADRERFQQKWKKLDAWLDEQRPNLTTEKERLILDQINAAYDAYHAAAANVLATGQTGVAGGNPSGPGSANVERESLILLDLGLQLVEAHQASMSRFLSESRKSLISFRSLFFSGLAVLLAMGTWGAVVAYRGLVSPLKLKLIESRAIIERHEKLASLGMLAAGVAHEIRNPLTAIKARLFTLQKLLQPGSLEQADADIIGREIGRLERIVKDFLLFARPSEPELAAVHAGEPLREVQALLAPLLDKAHIRLVLEEPPPARIRIDPQQIKQVLINLVQNGADAIGQNGSVTLRARLDSKRLGERTAKVVILEVADTGQGIPPEVAKRLFDPFFSTKEGGTGLGLSIAARIVQKHGGALQYQTQVDCGTTFGIVLPCAADDSP